MDLKTVTDRTIYLGIVGSNAYGTALPGGVSDFDYAGVCIPTKECFIGNARFEQANKWTDDAGNKIDKTIYSLQKAITLMLDNNPNMMDLLFLDKTIVKCAPEWERIRQHRDKFLSTKMYHSYQGYQYSQIERIRTHRSYLLNPVHKPIRSEYGLPEKSVFPDTMVEVIAKLASDYISEDNRKDFMAEMTALNDNEAVNIFRRYVEPHLVPIVMADFKQGQKAFLHMISSLSGRFIKDEYVPHAVNELRYLSSYWNWKRYSEWERNRNPKRKELEAKCGFDCYSDDTEFLTEDGWKKFDDISENDKLATVFVKSLHKNHSYEHISDFSVQYQNFTERYEGTFTGNMYRFYGHHMDSLVTPNHRMLSREVEKNNDIIKTDWQLIESSNLSNCYDFINVITPLKKVYTYKDNNHLNDINIDIKDYLKLIGWYLSDGTICFRKNKNGISAKSIRISQKKNGRLHREMKSFYKKYNKNVPCSLYEYVRKPNKIRNYEITEVVLDIRDIGLVNKILANCSYKFNKRIPRWCFKLPKNMIETLFNAMYLGDGTTRNIKSDNKPIVYYTNSLKLANDVNELMFLAGWKTSLWGPYESVNNLGKNIMYQVHVNKVNEQYKRFTNAMNREKIPVTNQRIVCFTVPNSTLVTRRNGRIHIHGNSKHGMHAIRLGRQCLEVMEGKGLNVDRTGIDAEELIEIRLGNKPFEWVLEESTKLMKKSTALYSSSKLPRSPDRKFIENIMMEVIEDYVFRK